ncbi:hypothetical protein CTAYLR_006906 [Chrysophaeum taylorii]|uniref:RAP domain-containing protein n=1 Tax=Chrysophaeum taylorii TaxID=2483200 RepID=A0AAD7UG09_9STRA|nr:hypothetical protein CTAYLR_006906 [Chrysophaeum taylorii]
MAGRGATPDTILSLFAARGDKFSARNLSTAAHRVAKFGGRNSDVRRDRRVMALADARRRCVREFDAQALANTAWAFATAGVEARQLFVAIAGEANSRLGEFNPQDLANAARAFATAGIEEEAPQLFAAIAGAANSRLREFNSQDLANTAWAFATAGIEASQLFAAIAGATTSRLSKFNAQVLNNTAWAFAKAGVEAPRLFAAIAGAASSRLHEFEPQNLANLAWAFATASVEAPELFAAIVGVAPLRLDEFEPQEFAITSWAFACVDWNKDPDFFSELEALARHLALLHFRLEWPDRSWRLSNHDKMLLAAFQRQDPSPSQLQRDVATALVRVGWTPHVFEHVTDEGLSLGTWLNLTPSSGSRVENGSTRFKSRLLRRLGWDVAHIPFFEWQALQDEREQDAYLRANKLHALGNIMRDNLTKAA